MPLNLGVTFHSFTSEWVSYVWSFEDLMYNAAQLGGGVEIVGPAHHRDFPHVPDEFVATFTSSVRRNGLTPTSYGSYADPFMRWDRDLTADELVAYTLPQLHGAARLGFPIVRLQNFAAEVVERLLPTAEKLGIRMGYELHVPLDLDSERTRFLVEQINRIDSPYLGLIPDAGIFARSVTQARLAHGEALGLSTAQVAEVVDLWRSRGTREQSEELIARFKVSPQATEWAERIWGSFGHSDPADLKHIFRHVIHVHGKFYSMRDGDEPDIRFRDLVFALLDNGYQGWISSEYEGEPADSFALVAEHQAMLRRYAAEYETSRS
jgi:sugar phosphate isomerase/epimerase